MESCALLSCDMAVGNNSDLSVTAASYSSFPQVTNEYLTPDEALPPKAFSWVRPRLHAACVSPVAVLETRALNAHTEFVNVSPHLLKIKPGTCCSRLVAICSKVARLPGEK